MFIYSTILFEDMSHSILVVEDDPVMVAFLDEYLSGSFETIMMTTAEEAWERLQQDAPVSVVLLDLFLPGMNGFEFLEVVRKESRFDRLPVLILSGSEKSEDRVRALEAGADDFVVKPFNPMELAARVRNLIRRTSA